MIDFLSKYSRNVWTLGFRAYVDRLREVLDAEPERAKAVTDEGVTPLWWLPDDEETALQIVNLYLASGADPNSKNRSGSTAAEWARKRGMLNVVARLESAMVPTTAKRTAVGPQLQRYEELAGDLVRAYESGFQPALDHLNNHYRTSLSWDELRTLVQQHLKMIPKSEMPMSEMYEGYFALKHAQLLVARQAGFASWEELRRHC